MAPSDQWRWTDDSGVQRLLNAVELRTALADGRLKPTTLVWRRGMKRWLPAASVPELAPRITPGLPKRGGAAELGPVATITPSIPPPTSASSDSRTVKVARPMPENLVDIAALRSRSERRRKDTLSGGAKDPAAPQGGATGQSPVDEAAAAAQALGIPPPPRVPSTAEREGAEATEPETRRQRKRKITRVGGPWSTAEAEEDTATFVRNEEQAGSPQPGDAGADEGSGRGHRMPAAQQPPREGSPSVPPLARSVSPGARGSAEAAQGRISRPPPPKRPARGGLDPIARRSTLRMGSGVADRVRGEIKAKKKEGRSIPPPAPKRRRRKGAAVEPAAPAVDAKGGTSAAAQDSPAAGPADRAAQAIAGRSGLEAKRIVEVGEAAPAEPEHKPIELKVDKKLPATSELPAATSSAQAQPAAHPSFAAAAASAPAAAQPAAQSTPAAPEPVAAPVAAAPAAAPVAAAPAAAPAAGEPRPPWEVGTPPPGPAVVAERHDSWPRPPAPSPTGGLTVRLSALIGAAVVVGLLLASSFLVGRLTAPAQTGIAEGVRARTGFAAVPLFARTRPVESKAAPRPCLMLRAPANWAPEASKSIPFEILPTPAGKLAVGYAKGSDAVRGFVVDPDTGTVEDRFEPDKGAHDLSRVVPMVDAEGALRFEATREEQAGVHNAVWVTAAKPFVVGFKGGQCVAVDEPGGEPRTLWAVEGKGPPTALRTLVVPGKGIAVAYRHDKRAWSGWLGEDGSVVHEAKAFESSAVQSGKPMIAHNGQSLSLVFAERPAKKEPAVVRWARAPLGQGLSEALPVALPPGGPGGDAIAPAVAGLSGSRWLLMWTEGQARKQRVLRAQTYDAEGKPLGEALRVSPATGSFGQGTVGVKGESAAVLFLLASRRGYRRVYEMWGTVLQCQ